MGGHPPEIATPNHTNSRGGSRLNIIVAVDRCSLDSCSAIRLEAAMGRRVWFPVVSGPLAPFAAGYESWLRSRAYSPSGAADRVYQFDQLSRWLQREGLCLLYT